VSFGCRSKWRDLREAEQAHIDIRVDEDVDAINPIALVRALRRRRRDQMTYAEFGRRPKARLTPARPRTWKVRRSRNCDAPRMRGGTSACASMRSSRPAVRGLRDRVEILGGRSFLTVRRQTSRGCAPSLPNGSAAGQARYGQPHRQRRQSASHATVSRLVAARWELGSVTRVCLLQTELPTHTLDHVKTRMFPTDPNAPGGPERAEYLRRNHLDRTPPRARFPTPRIPMARDLPRVTWPALPRWPARRSTIAASGGHSPSPNRPAPADV
jgi:hypothetical protein